MFHNSYIKKGRNCKILLQSQKSAIQKVPQEKGCYAISGHVTYRSHTFHTLQFYSSNVKISMKIAKTRIQNKEQNAEC